MASYIKNLLKQLPFYGKAIKPRIKKFTNARLLSELPFFLKLEKAEIKQLTTEKLLQEQPFYKQPIKKPHIKKLSDQEHTIKYQEHQPNSIGTKLICIDDRFTLLSITFKVKIVLIDLSHGY